MTHLSCVYLFCFARFGKVRTDTCEHGDHYWPYLTVGRLSGSKIGKIWIGREISGTIFTNKD